MVEGADVELAHDLVRHTRLTGGDAHHLVASLPATKVLAVGQLFLGQLLPEADKDVLQLIHRRSFNAAVHVAPFTHLLGAYKVVVGHVHTSRIAYLPVDDHNLTVVAGPDVVHPRKTDGVELVDLDAVFVEGFQV